MEHLPPVGWADVATKDDLHQLESRLDSKIDGLDARLSGRMDGLDAKIDSVESRILAELHSTLRTNTYMTIGAIAAMGAVISTTVGLT